MMVMVSNQSRAEFHYLAGAHPGRIGWLLSPAGQRSLFPWFPYALDNGAFPIWSRGGTWDADAFYKLLAWASGQDTAPLWVAVPDVVGDKAGTLVKWAEWEPVLRPYGWPLAFVVQDGMTTEDVPTGADVIFVGGSTKWKRRTLGMWCDGFKRVHIGRVNSERFLWICTEYGAESVDGTGWWHKNDRQLYGLMRWCEDHKNGHRQDPYENPRLL